MDIYKLAGDINLLYISKHHSEAYSSSIELLNMFITEVQAESYKKCISDADRYMRVVISELKKDVEKSRTKS